jgi:hypothetical protein
MSKKSSTPSPAEIERTKQVWLERLGELVDRVEQWARQLDWSTRRIDKRMEDSILGTYQAPALLLQQDVAKLFLEPISHSTYGSEGAADLCLMPAYDDIASFYYTKGSWHVHYLFEEAPPAIKFDKTKTRPLSQEAFNFILNSMKVHAQSIE